MKKKIIVIGGPTAIGKTELTIKLAEKWKTEIISADARQFYKELNIGVAKPSRKELNTVPHHFIGHISIEKKYSVGQYETDVLKKITELFKKHNVIFVCGGSGLYIQAICDGLNDFPEINHEVKIQLKNDLIKKGLEHLIRELKKHDIETYRKIDKKNPRRVLRALEVYRASGKPYSFYTKQKKTTRDFETIYIGINTDRQILYERINDRVDKMIENGLIKEAKKLYNYKDTQALNTIGYQELFEYFNQKISLNKAVEQIKQNTRRYAKRQVTWFSKEKYNQFTSNQEDLIIDFIKNQSK